MAVYESSLPRDLESPRVIAPGELGREPQASEREVLGWLQGMLSLDRHYHTVMATLTASENYPSRLVRAAAAFVGGEHYFFDPPSAGDSGEWAFPTSAALPALQRRFLLQMRNLFGAQIADWRPNGGSTCEQAVVAAACRRGDGFVQLGPADGGHFGSDELGKRIGAKAFCFPVNGDVIDVEGTVRLVEQHPRIRLLLIQPSHTRRPQPVAELAAAVGSRVTIAVDVSHTAGLIAGGVLPQPLKQGAHILSFNTHKTLAGPNKGVIAFADRNHPLAEAVWGWVCPGLQSNSHSECLPGLVLALEELDLYGRAYAEQAVANARVLARVLDENGVRVAGMEYGGTRTHQVHVVLGAAERSHAIANVRLPMCGIRTNSVLIPGTKGEFGLRLGTQALTRRGLVERDFTALGYLLAAALERKPNTQKIRRAVSNLLADHPLFPLRFSLDGWSEDQAFQQLFAEALS